MDQWKNVSGFQPKPETALLSEEGSFNLWKDTFAYTQLAVCGYLRLQIWEGIWMLKDQAGMVRLAVNPCDGNVTSDIVYDLSPLL